MRQHKCTYTHTGRTYCTKALEAECKFQFKGILYVCIFSKRVVYKRPPSELIYVYYNRLTFEYTY